MEIKEFVKNFASQFEETNVKEFFPRSQFKTIPEWSSLIVLSIIAMVDEEYGIKIKGEDIKNSNTIEDLYNIVKSKM